MPADNPLPSWMTEAHSPDAMQMTKAAPLVGVWELTFADQRLFWSEAVFRLFDVAPDSFAPSYEAFLQRVHPEDRHRVDEAYRRHLVERKAYGINHRILLPDGRVRFVHEHCHTLFASDGSPLRSKGTVVDITGQQQQAQQIRHLQKLAAVGKMSCGLLHDFNNLLTALQSYSDLAMMNPSGEQVPRYLERIQQVGDRAAALIRQLLMFSRTDVPQQREVAVIKLIDQFLPVMSRLMPESIRIHWQAYESDALSVWADANMLEQVLMNLLLNARDALQREAGQLSGEIVVAAQCIVLTADNAHDLPAGEYVMLTVSDDGCGIAAQRQADIWQPFFTSRAEGSGLGLPVARDIVLQHGGTIAMMSEEGVGSCFTVYLPRYRGQPLPATPCSRPTGQVRCADVIFVVDDDPMVLDSLTELLAGQGYRVCGALSAAAALELMQSRCCQPRLLLIDVMMPEMDGHTLVARLRADWPALPVLYMSGYLPVDVDRLCRDDALAGFVAKPLRLPALLQAMQRLLADSAASA